MSEALQHRIGGCAFALLIGLGVPAFLLGPFLFGGVRFELVSGTALWWSVAIGVFGLWLALVCAFAEVEVVENVMAPFAGSEAVVIFLPYMLFVCTAALWRRLLGRSKRA